MYIKTIRALLVSSFFFLLSLPSILAASFSDPLSFVGNIINDLFSGSLIGISEDSFIRFMYWVVLFTVVYFVGVQKTFKSFNSDENKGVAKKMGMVVSLVLATTGTVFTPIETLRFVFQMYSGIFAFIIMFAIFGYLFKLCYGKDALKDYPPIAVKIFRILVILTLLFAIIMARKYAGLDAILGFTVFQYVDPFMTVIQLILFGMLLYELFSGWGSGSGAGSSGGSGSSSGGDGGSHGAGSGGGSGGSGGGSPSGGSGASGSPSTPTTPAPFKKRWWKPWAKSPDVKDLETSIGKYKKLVTEYKKQTDKFAEFVSRIGIHPPTDADRATGIASNATEIAKVNNAADAISFVQKTMYDLFHGIATNENYSQLKDKVKADFQQTTIIMNENVVRFLENYKTLQLGIYPQVRP